MAVQSGENIGIDRSTIANEEEQAADHCDWGSNCIAPKWCQKFNRITWVMVFWCFASFFQGALASGILPAVITTLELRYLLSSTEVGVIVSTYDCITVCVIIFVSYYGGRGRKPRWVGIGALLLGIGSLLFALPQLIFGPYLYSWHNNSFCPISSDQSGSSEAPITPSSQPTSSALCMDDYGLANAFWVFLFSQVISGIGGSPMFTIGITYLDENVKPGTSPLLIGSFFAMSVIGPAIGFLITGASLSVYVDLTAPSADMTQESELWIGAWWLPFLASGCFLIVFVWLPITGFPKKLPVAHLPPAAPTDSNSNVSNNAIPDNGRQNAGQRPTPTMSKPLGADCASIARSLRIVAKNPTIWMISLANSATFFIIAVFSTFGPKFVQVRFGTDASSASLYFGAVIVPGASVGTFLGGLIIKRFNFSIQNIIRLCIACSVASLPLTLVFLLSCQTAPFAGLADTYPYLPNSTVNSDASSTQYSWIQPVALTTIPSLASPCNMNCSCSPSAYEPVCGSDGVEYYSACYAGCTSLMHAADGTLVFFSCSCIQPPASALAVVYENSHYSLTNSTSFATVSMCQSVEGSQCLLPLFLALIFVIACITFTTAEPSLELLMRCVPPETSAVSLALNSIVYRLLGTIPGPIVAGVLIDLSCTVWQHIDCSHQLACLHYNEASLTSTISILTAAVSLFQLLFFVAANFTYRTPKPAEIGVDSSMPIEIDLHNGTTTTEICA